MENRLMKWKAVCGDQVFSEASNAFDEINRDSLEYFLMEGLDTTFKHDVRSGQFSVNENNMCFLVNDKLVGKSNDIINYKEKLFMVTGDRSNDGFIRGYYTGWKEKTDEFDYLEILFWVDMIDQQIKLRIRATPNTDKALDTIFTTMVNGVLVNEVLDFEEVGVRKEFVFEIFS